MVVVVVGPPAVASPVVELAYLKGVLATVVVEIENGDPINGDRHRSPQEVVCGHGRAVRRVARDS